MFLRYSPFKRKTMAYRDDGCSGCIGQIVAPILIIFIGAVVDMCNHSESSMIKDARSHESAYYYISYLNKHPHGDYVEEALDSVYSISKRKNLSTDYNILGSSNQIKDLYDLANNAPIKGSRIEKKIKDYIYSSVLQQNKEILWEEYISCVNVDDIRDANDRLAKLRKAADEQLAKYEKENWGTETAAWKTAKTDNTPFQYKKYMERYPTGKHYKDAKRRYIELSIANDSQAPHNELPTMEQTSYGNGNITIISISNNTSYDLTVMYSGIDHEYVSMSAGETKSVRLSNGTYKISARVSSSNVRPCYGVENVSGGSYSVSYYISSY